uniref:PD-(D/E)XK nuclease family transposase n=1 Tax=Lachnospira sp. TaxID=2049031 RepID=UPI003FEEC9D7
MRLPKSTTKLKQYFPLIREREDIKQEIRENPKLLEKYREWDEEQQNSLANVEVQKIGYSFPGQRSACYSSDLLLRQYKRVKGEKKKAFSYKDIKSVYTIVFFETSIKEFHEYPQNYIHKFKQQSDTGLELELLQKYVFIPLDIFRTIYHNNVKSNGKNGGGNCWNRTEAWLTFLSTDEPEIIIELISQYPEFKEMYEEIYVMCQNVEKVMEMFSKELIQLDRNTVQYMIDEMQDTIDVQKEELEAKQETIDTQKEKLEEQKTTINTQKEELEAKQNTIDTQKDEIETMKQQLQSVMAQIEQLKKQ